MSNLVLNTADKFPVGTVVSAYPAAAVHHGQAYGTAVDSATVASDGTLTLTALVDGTAYQIGAAFNGVVRHMKVIKGSVSAAGTTWQARVAARRAAIGTS